MSVFDMIRAQQGKERTAVWMVGEQLMDILRREAEDIIREFYGLHRSAAAPARERGIVVDLADFL